VVRRLKPHALWHGQGQHRLCEQCARQGRNAHSQRREKYAADHVWTCAPSKLDRFVRRNPATQTIQEIVAKERSPRCGDHTPDTWFCPAELSRPNNYAELYLTNV